MFIKQADLYWGLDTEFIKEVMEEATQRTYEEGETIFREGNAATAFYTLIKGRIRLTIGTTGQMVHLISHPGESFGWSSLVGRDTYSATAVCRIPTRVIQINRDRFNAALDHHPASAVLIFKRLANLLGNRLLNTYEMLSVRLSADAYVSEGTGQLQELSGPEA